jgi:dihydroorotase-like cyclic amidohydrolase
LSLPLLLYQVKCGNLALERLKEVTTYKPAEIIGVTAGPDTGVEWEMSEYRIEDETRLRSGAGWTPFLGMLAVGEVKSVRIGGRQVVQKGKVLQKAGRVVSTRGEVI